MTRRVLVFLAVSGIVAGGCRALIGIDDLEAVPDGGPPRGPNGNEGGPGGGNGGRDGGGGEGGGPSFDIDTCLAQGVDCRRCCKDGLPAFRDTFAMGLGIACLCEAGSCAPQCGSACTSLTPVVPSAECSQCTDDFLGRPGSNPCASACGADRDCQLGVACLQKCVENRR